MSFVGSCHRLLTRCGEAIDFRLACFSSGPRRVDLTGALGQTFTTIRKRTCSIGHGLLDFGDFCFCRRSFSNDRIQGQAILGNHFLGCCFLILQTRGFGLKGLGVTGAGVFFGFRGTEAHALGSKFSRAAQALLERGQREPGFLGCGQRWGLFSGFGLNFGFTGQFRGQQRFQLRALGSEGFLIRGFGIGNPAQLHEVIGHQSQSRIANVALDHSGSARGLCLTTQRLELATQFSG